MSYALDTSYNATLIASPDPSLGMVGPFGITLNGAQIIDDVALFRAVSAVIYGRQAQKTTYKFRVTRQFSSLRLAQEFLYTHQGTLAANADLLITCGAPGDQSTVKLAACAYAAIDIIEVSGISVVIEYTFIGGLFALV
jgi:hypothetical protein